MPVVLASGTLSYTFQQSDNMGKGIVILLMLLSIWAWTIMLNKWLVIREVGKHSRRLLKGFEDAVSPLDLALQLDRYKGPIARVYQAGIDEMMDVLDADPNLVEKYCRARRLPRPLAKSEIDKIRSTMERTVAGEIMSLEERLGMLGTIVTISPFLGLLGTVWGVMMAFVGMARKGRPDIGAIAPGVSGALLTTVVGLVVAIPSVVGYNTIANTVRKTTVQMDNFVEEFIARLNLQENQG